ncbi:MULTISPECIES: cysteine-rich CWC family protein [unclassified Neptuniibacter]|uniref:cysteine-rich CWC family protein n=1 Tax=unclassified Neptuniibacter TaxID=2630693 RepID=UPI0026E27917|nr:MULTISPECIES: cysteine-rich CWC family protein [unclassified Neptuniibacter]MDO6514582.1 cysteine-rich CWC family protein [Neptuniibacter sp. 2_MG-2023]MDO6594662.1 cysteine-rich CWC family protein [Neptuniibacter sp. 1_MG-2023]
MVAINGLNLLFNATTSLGLLTLNQEDLCPSDKCPLCGKDNHCGHLNSSGEALSCWCSDSQIEFPHELVSQVSASHLNTACICKACVLATKSIKP